MAGRCCEHCPRDFDNVVTRTDIDDALAEIRSEMREKIEDLQRTVEALSERLSEVRDQTPWML